MSNLEPSTNRPSIEVPGFPGVNLGVLLPHDVVALKEYVDHYGKPDGSPAERLNRAMGLALDGVLETLPEQHRDFGHAVLLASVECPDDVRRSQTGLWVPSLARADHDAGVALWDRLLRDEDHDVRNTAFEMMDRAPITLADHSGVEISDAAFAKLGLTWRDGIQLLQSYQGAERGEGIVYVDRGEDHDEERYLEQLRARGQVALFKLVNLTNPEGS